MERVSHFLLLFIFHLVLLCSLSFLSVFRFFSLWDRGRSTLVNSDWQWIFPECWAVLCVTLAGLIRNPKMRYLHTCMCIKIYPSKDKQVMRRSEMNA